MLIIPDNGGHVFQHHEYIAPKTSLLVHIHVHFCASLSSVCQQLNPANTYADISYLGTTIEQSYFLKKKVTETEALFNR